MKKFFSPYSYGSGLREGLPIALGYLTVSFGFGISASANGLTVLEAVLISFTNLTSTGQIAGISLIAAGGTIIEMILTQIVVSLRYSLMAISISQRMDDACTLAKRPLLAMTLTDEIFAVAVSKPKKVGPPYLLGLLTLPVTGWTFGTFLGTVAGNLLPEDFFIAAGILIYVMLLAILIVPMREEGFLIFPVALAAGLHCILYFIPAFSFITDGFAVIISSVVATAILSLFLPMREEREEAKRHAA